MLTSNTSESRCVGLTTNPIYVQDLAVWLPALAIVAVLLWQRRPSGIFLAGAGLVFWTIEAIGVAVDQWFGHRADPTSNVATLAATAMFVVLAGATLVPLALWLRAVPARTREVGNRERNQETGRASEEALLHSFSACRQAT